MSGLLWFHGITWETTVGEIGWTYVLLGLFIALLVWNIVFLWRLYR